MVIITLWGIDRSVNPPEGTNTNVRRSTPASSTPATAVSAKGLEDTAFYNDVLLLSTNDVGGELERHTKSVREFHDDNSRRLADWPLEMTAASTHDTKRGEDARTRISVITELEDEWRQQVSRWITVNRHAHTDVAGVPAPDRNDEWMFYQALLGAWPAEHLDAPVPGTADNDLVERMRVFMREGDQGSQASHQLAL